MSLQIMLCDIVFNLKSVLIKFIYQILMTHIFLQSNMFHSKVKYTFYCLQIISHHIDL